MVIYKMKNYDAMSKKASNIVAAQIILKPNSVLGLATGSTPIGMYQNLIQQYQNDELDFSEISTVNLDEYKGLDGENHQSYRYFMNHNLFDHVNINPADTSLPDGKAEDSDAECKRYDEVILSKGGVDLQVLGLGHNGHIGFNEPDMEFPKNTHCVTLQPSTIQANARLFEKIEEVPHQAYTMGIGTIMAAKKILILVSGKDKAQIVKEAFMGPVTPTVPASILQLHHDVILVGDEEALSML